MSRRFAAALFAALAIAPLAASAQDDGQPVSFAPFADGEDVVATIYLVADGIAFRANLSPSQLASAACAYRIDQPAWLRALESLLNRSDVRAASANAPAAKDGRVPFELRGGIHVDRSGRPVMRLLFNKVYNNGLPRIRGALDGRGVTLEPLFPTSLRAWLASQGIAPVDPNCRR